MKRLLAFVLSIVFLCGIGSLENVQAIEQNSLLETISLYDDFDTSDPNFISDEELFGKWENGEWSLESLFDYGRCGGLLAVEEAVKENDYYSAKQELLNYYRDKLKSHNYVRDRSSGKTARPWILWAEMTANNFYLYDSNVMPIEKFTLTREEKHFNVDMRSKIAEIIKAGNNTLDMVIFDIKKDGYMAKFLTKEAANESDRPYIKITVNGSTRTYYPKADTTIRAGSYKSETCGADEYMFSNESYLTFGEDKHIMTDDYSRRSCLLFDFSDIDKNDKIEYAEMHIKGSMTEDEIEMERVDKDSIDAYLVAFSAATNWNENYYNWSNSGDRDCYCFDGRLGADIRAAGMSNGYEQNHELASIYAQIARMDDIYYATKDETYLFHSIRMVINCILELRENFMVYQPGFQASGRVSGLVSELYHMIFSEYMTPEYFTMMVKFIYMHTEFLVETWGVEEEINNIGNIQNSGLLKAAMTFNEFKKYTEPLGEVRDTNNPGSVQGGWLAVGVYRSLYKLMDTVNEDGTSVEAPLSYAVTNLSYFYSPFKWAETIGMTEELAGVLSEEDKQKLKNSALVAAKLENPIKGTWQTGDGAKYTYNASKELAQIARQFLGTKDPELEWVYSGGKEGIEPEGTSYANDTIMKTTLRSSWYKDAVALYMDADGGYKSHSHHDDLAIELMAYGTYLLADPLAAEYLADDESTTNWQKSTRAHNTIEINQFTQLGRSPRHGEVEEPFGEVLHNPWGFAPIGTLHPEIRHYGNVYDYLRAETKAYMYKDQCTEGNYDFKNYKAFRDVLFVRPGYFLVTDYIEPEDLDDVNSYRQSWHINPQYEFEVKEDSKNIVTKSGTSANLVVAPVDSDGEIMAKIHPGFYNPDGANTQNTISYDYTAFHKEKKGVVTYNTILYPVRPSENVEILSSELPLDITSEQASAFYAIIDNTTTNERTEISYYSLFDEMQKANRKFGYYNTDGILAFVEKVQNEYSTMIMRKGSKLSEESGISLIDNGNKEIDHIGIRIDAGKLYLETDDENQLDIDNLKIYCNRKISQAFINDVSVYFEKIGDYIYFTQTGLKDEETNSPTIEEKPSHSSVPKDDNNFSSNGGSGGGGSVNNDDEESNSEENGENSDSDDRTGTDNPFADIVGHWARDAINAVYADGIVNGDENGDFNPDDKITRAQLIAMAVRMLDIPETQFKPIYGDVKESDWFAGAVIQAMEQGIISNDKNFRPNDNVTREELSKILVEVANLMGKLHEQTEAELNFIDDKDISTWAVYYVKNAVSNGIMQGMGDNTFAPKKGATRAEVATVIYRLLQKNK